MEKKKAPVHDFAPSWLKITSIDKADYNTNSKKQENHRLTSLSGEDSFDLRPQYLKKEISNHKDTSSSSNKQAATNLTSSSSSLHGVKEGLLSTVTNTNYSSNRSTPFDYEGEELSRGFGGKIWSSNNNHTSGGNLNSNWPNNNRRYNLKSKLTGGVSGEDSSRRSNSIIKGGDGNIGGVGSVSIGREDLTKTSPGFHHHPSHSHHQGNKGRLVNSSREDSSPVDGDGPGESCKGKSNTKNGFVDSNKFKEEFPSLIDEKQVNLETTNGNNVWDNVANKVFRSGSSKVSLVSRHLGSSLYGEKGSRALNGEKSLNGGSNYFRTLVPVVPKRKPVNGINGSGSKENTTLVNSLSNLSLGSTNKMLPVFGKPVNHSSSGHSMAILVKKHPKMRSNKNEFLPSLRSSSSDGTSINEEEQRVNDPFDDDEERANSACLEGSNDGQDETGKKREISIGRGGDKVLDDEENDNDVQLLSSSLEAEERLLREMGWKEEDGDDNFYAPLTEDEVKEFKDLINTRTSFKRHTSPNINQGQFKFQANSNQLLSQLNFFNSLSTEDQDKDETDSTSEDDDDDDEDER